MTKLEEYGKTQEEFLAQTPDKDRKPNEIRRDELVSIELVQGLRRIEQKLDEIIKVLTS